MRDLSSNPKLTHKEVKELFNQYLVAMVAIFDKKNKGYGNTYFNDEYDKHTYFANFERKFYRLKSIYKGETATIDEQDLKDTFIDMANYSILELIRLFGGDDEKD